MALLLSLLVSLLSINTDKNNIFLHHNVISQYYLIQKEYLKEGNKGLAGLGYVRQKLGWWKTPFFLKDYYYFKKSIKEAKSNLVNKQLMCLSVKTQGKDCKSWPLIESKKILSLFKRITKDKIENIEQRANLLFSFIYLIVIKNSLEKLKIKISDTEIDSIAQRVVRLLNWDITVYQSIKEQF